MRRVIVDACAFAAVTFKEAEAENVAFRLRDVELYAPKMLQLEMAHVAWKKMRRQPRDGVAILTLLQAALGEGSDIHWMDVNATDVVLVAQATGLTPYDAAYLWLAGSLGADLVTLDKRLAAAAESAVI